MRAYTEHFLAQKNTCWKCSDIFKGIVLLKDLLETFDFVIIYMKKE